MYRFYSKINRGQVSRPLYRGCPLFGGSVIRGFTVVLYGKINRGQVICPLYRGSPLFGGSVIRGFTVNFYNSMQECI